MVSIFTVERRSQRENFLQATMENLWRTAARSRTTPRSPFQKDGLSMPLDGGGVEEVELVLKGSLGCMSNHAVDDASNARFVYKGWISPISQCVESCWLVSRKKGGKHTEVASYYTTTSIRQALRIATAFRPWMCCWSQSHCR